MPRFRIYRRELKYPRSILDGIRASKNPAMFLTVLEDLAALVGLGIAAAGIALRWWTGIAAFDKTGMTRPTRNEDAIPALTDRGTNTLIFPSSRTKSGLSSSRLT